VSFSLRKEKGEQGGESSEGEVDKYTQRGGGRVLGAGHDKEKVRPSPCTRRRRGGAKTEVVVETEVRASQRTGEVGGEKGRKKT